MAQSAGQLGNETKCCQQGRHGNKIQCCDKKIQIVDEMGPLDVPNPSPLRTNRTNTLSLTLNLDDVISQSSTGMSLMKPWNSETRCLALASPLPPVTPIVLKVSNSAPVCDMIGRLRSTDIGAYTEPPMEMSQSYPSLDWQKHKRYFDKKKKEAKNAHCTACFGVQGGGGVYTEPKRTCL